MNVKVAVVHPPVAGNPPEMLKSAEGTQKINDIGELNVVRFKAKVQFVLY